jgi:hypothetical protein
LAVGHENPESTGAPEAPEPSNAPAHSATRPEALPDELPDDAADLTPRGIEHLLSPGSRHDLSDQGNAASRSLMSLARAARAFLLYDPANEAIRVFLEAIQTSFMNYLDTYGPLILSVRPYEIAVENEVVYKEEEREKSLAFKLFRDGVRRLTVFEDVEWSELLRLLEILSIRYSGIRLNEDDIVTLLWKANFQHIEVEAVEGFVPEEEDFDEQEFYESDIASAPPTGGGVVVDKEKKAGDGTGVEGAPVPEGDDKNITTMDPALMAQQQADLQAVADEHAPVIDTGASLPQEMEQAMGRSASDEVEDALPDGELGISVGNSIIPNDMDLPSPQLAVVGTVLFKTIEPVFIESLLDEDGSGALPTDCLNLVGELLVLVESPREAILLEEVAPLLHEIRDFMLTEGHLSNLMKLLQGVADFAANMGEDEQAQALVQSFANAHALARLIRSVPSSVTEPPEEFYDLLDKLPGDHLTTLMDLLESERGASSRRITRQLIEHFIPGREGWVTKRLISLHGAVAADLLRCLANVDEEAAWDAVMEFVAGDDVDTQLECLHVLSRAGATARSRAYLFRLMGAKEVQVRIRSIGILASQGDSEIFPVLVKHLTSARVPALEEATAVGIAMAQVSGEESLETFGAWIKPKGFFKKLKPTRKCQDQAAISGLSLLDEDLADELLKALAARVDGDSHRLCVQARMKRHRRVRGLED